MAKKNEIAKVAAPDGDVPDYIKKGARGNESVGTDDLIIPRLTVLQTISPEVDEDDPKHVAGAKAGMFVNSLTKELYPSPLKIVPIFYQKEWVVFAKRTAGGGFKGSFPSPAEAQEFIRGSENANQLEAIETANHFCFILKDNGKTEEVVFSMTSTKLKASRTLNSLIRMRAADRWAGVYIVTTTKESNDKGTFHNISIANAGWAPKDVYVKGEETYKGIIAGSKAIDREAGTEEEKEY